MTEGLVIHNAHLDGFTVKATKEGDTISMKLSMPFHPETLETLTKLQGRVLGYIIRALPEVLGRMTDPDTGEVVYEDEYNAVGPGASEQPTFDGAT